MKVLKNPRHEEFAQELARGKTAKEAYRLAGYMPDDGHASRLARNGKVSGRVRELQEQTALEASIERADVIGMLLADRQFAMSNGHSMAAVKATELIGREIGMFVERREIGGPGDFRRMSDAELQSECIKALNTPVMRALLRLQ